MHSKTKNLFYVICLFLRSVSWSVLAKVIVLPRAGISLRWLGGGSHKYQSIVLTKTDVQACRQPDVASFFNSNRTQ